jgi:hypothetical protein
VPVNDELDPLDTWLGQQVHQLPPPPGTFELITRRARRRKVRKLAVSAGGVAAVAAAIAVAVPGGLILRVSPAPVTGVAAGGQSSAASSPVAQSPLGTASRAPTRSPTHAPASTSPAPTPSSTPLTEPSGPVPGNFQPTSVTFVSTDLGWVIGQAGTPGHCADQANPDICTSIARTDNAGQTWEGGPAPTAAPAQNGVNGVAQIRFLDGINGWAYGPQLWATHDAGHTWHRVPTGGRLVIGLETAGDRAFAVWASCPAQPGHDLLGYGDAVGCTSYTLMSTPAGADGWQPVGAGTTGLTTGAGGDTTAKIVLSGSTGYLYLNNAAGTTLYSGPLDGTWQQAGTLPCVGAEGGLALAGSTLAAVCAGQTPTLLRSGDGGQSWTKAAVTWPEPAPSAKAGTRTWTIWSFAAAPGGTLVLATDNGLYVLPAGTSQWELTNVTGKGAPDGGFSYVGMTTDNQGVAVPWDTSRHEIWMSFDGGLTWAPRSPIAP